MSEQSHHPPMRPAQEQDPVCGMKVDPAKAAASIEYEGATFCFCSQGCAAKFRATPEKYAPAKSIAAPPHPAGMTEPQGEYTCPMHPQIVRPGPGSCPICGMALEPREVAAEESNPELINMTRRFWISVALAAPMLALMVSSFLPPCPCNTCSRQECGPGLNSPLQLRWSCGAGYLSLSGAGNRSCIAVSTCSR
jgi:YHS domain-containing protein